MRLRHRFGELRDFKTSTVPQCLQLGPVLRKSILRGGIDDLGAAERLGIGVDLLAEYGEVVRVAECTGQ